MQVIDIQLYRELGIEAASLVIVIGFARYITTRSFTQMDRTSKQLEENQERFLINNEKFLKFAEEQHKQTQEVLEKHNEQQQAVTEALVRLNETLETHVKEKNDALALIREKDKTINELFSMLKSCLRTN